MVFYFTGHGSRSVLYASGANGVNPAHEIPLDTVTQLFNRSTAGTKLIFVDSCRTPAPTGAMASVPPLLEPSTFDALKPQGLAIFFSSDFNEPSWIDDSVGYGYFTKHLLRGLRRSIPETRDIQFADDLLNYLQTAVNDDVLRHRKLRQFPRAKFDPIRGRFALYPSPLPASKTIQERAPAAEAPPPSLDEIMRDVRHSIVLIDVREELPQGPVWRSGMGFVVASQGYILTSAKLVARSAGATRHTIQIGGELWELWLSIGPPAAVVGIDSLQRFALIRVQGERALKALVIANSDEVRIGQELVTFFRFAPGMPRIDSRLVQIAFEDAHGWQLDSDYQLAVGAPVLDRRGRVVGMTVPSEDREVMIGGSRQPGTHTIPINYAKPLLSGVSP